MTPKPLAWTDRALDDLEQIAADDPVAAEQWVEGLLAVAQCAAELPTSGRSSKAELVATGVFAVNFMCCPCAVRSRRVSALERMWVGSSRPTHAPWRAAFARIAAARKDVSPSPYSSMFRANRWSASYMSASPRCIMCAHG